MLMRKTVSNLNHINIKTSDDVNIHAVELGSGEMVLFLIHGWSNNWEIWQDIATLDEENKFTFVAIDVPGFGDSDRLTEYSLERTADLLVEFITKYLEQRESYASAHVGGLSLGSILSSYIAAKRILEIDGYVLMGPMFSGHRHAVGRYFMKSALGFTRKSVIARKFLDMSVRSQATSYFFGKYFNTYKFDWNTYKKNLRGKSLMDIYAYIDIGIEVVDFDTLDKLAQKNENSSILLLMGKYDKVVDAEGIHSGKVFDLTGITNLSTEIVDESGHIVSYEKPKETFLAIENFVKESLVR